MEMMIGTFPWMKTKRYFSSLLLQLGENLVSLRLRRLKKYIKRAGGYDGKIEKVIVEYPNGIKLRKKWYTNPKMLPGSEIYVYSQPDKEKREKSGDGMSKFIEVITVITGALTTIVLTRAL